MAASIVNPVSVAQNKLAIKQSNQYFCLPTRKKNMICCQNRSNLIRTFTSNHGKAVKDPNGNKHLLFATTKTSVQFTAEGIGIVKFLKGKNLLITGSTGFVAKVLVEKILSTAPDVGKIFLLINTKNKEAAMDRLKNEIMDTELFKCLKQTYGESYQAFMLSKVVPVIGNLLESDLGINADIADELADQVDVIINSAANTTFDERYDVAIDINTLGPCRILSFAKRCTKLKLYVHISTAYVSGIRQGKIKEKLFSIDDTEKSFPVLDPEAEIMLALESKEAFGDDEVTQKMKQLGLERARIHGWRNTYEFSKVMGEMQINKVRGKIPVVIVRPTIIESSYKDPFPGWIEGNRMLDPVISFYGKGLLTAFLADPKEVLDIVPVDMVVNGTLAAMAKHSTSTGKPELNIYHIASSVVNPLVIQQMLNLFYEHFNSSPYMDSQGKPIQVSRVKLFTSTDEFISHIYTKKTSQPSELASTANEKLSAGRSVLQSMHRKTLEKLKHIAISYQPYSFYGGRFDNINSQRLMEEMSEEEKKSFGFDLRNIDWTHYIKNVHIPGLRRHVMKQN